MKLPQRTNLLIAAAALCAATPLRARAQTPLPPRYDHVVVVVVENINYGEIVGSPSAPYLNMLINQGASLSQFYSYRHTSAPEYGELFAGDENGIVDGVISPAVPYTTPNLGATLRQNGYSFVGYSQSMPSIGYTGLTSGQYTRGHNPWVNWQNDAPDAHANQLPSTTNVPFSLFPATTADFAQLPTVSFVIPDNDHNMHNGSTLAQRLSNGDNFLKDSLDAYYQWAKANNSLLIVTADEDDRSGPATNYNRIPTIIAGANVKAGVTIPQTYTLHNALRTLEDIYALPHAAGGNYARSILGAFAGDAPVSIATFQSGANNYTGAHDTCVRADAPTTTLGATTPLMVDLDTNTTAGGNQPAQALTRFDNIAGAGAGQVPADATVISAKLRLWTSGNTANKVELHRMLVPWSESSTWNIFGSGVQTNDVMAASGLASAHAPRTADEPFFFDVSDSVQAWLDGAPNYGWAVVGTGTDDYMFHSSEATTASQRPLLEVAYALYPRFTASGGNWGDSANWAYGVPNADGSVARFLTRPSNATITLDGNKTVAALLFDSPAGSYTVAGNNEQIFLQNYGNLAKITVKSGQHTIAAPLVLNDPTIIDISAGAALSATVGVDVSIGSSLTKIGAGVFDVGPALLNLNSRSTATVEGGELRAAAVVGDGAVAIKSGAVLKLTGGRSLGSRFTSLALDPSARLDVGAGGFVLDYTDATPLMTLVQQIKTARAANWAGSGIGSSVAAADATSAVGIAEAAEVLHLATGQSSGFMGQAVDATTVLVRLTKCGDATLDGNVDFDDLVQLAQNYNQPVGASGWFHGDFDYSGTVDFNDLTMLAQNYNTSVAVGGPLPAGFAADWQAALAVAETPEPGLASLLVATASGLLRRKPRRTN